MVDQVMPLLYNELHRLADRHMRGERVNHTLNATALIHEAYFRLSGQKESKFSNRAHFLALASMVMRRILINHAEKRSAAKRGGGEVLATFNEETYKREVRNQDLLDLDEALARLERVNERQAKVVQYWFFGGLTHQEIAEVLAVSLPTVRRDWRLASAWLSTQLGRDSLGGDHSAG